MVLGQGTRSSLDTALPAVVMLAASGWLGLVLVGAFPRLRLVPDRWQGGEAGAAVERHDRQVRGDPDGARRELLAGMALRVSSSAGARQEDGAQRRPADRRSEADAGSAGMEGVRRRAERAASGGLDPVEPNSASPRSAWRSVRDQDLAGCLCRREAGDADSHTVPATVQRLAADSAAKRSGGFPYMCRND